MDVYPVVDLFAGPGGLGEGFSQRYNRDGTIFKPVASVENNTHAHQTLVLRHFFRSFKPSNVPDDYYQYLDGKICKNTLIERNSEHWSIASRSVWQISLARKNRSKINNKLRKALKQTKKWVLIGGPPCQAYSLIGRSRMRNMLDFENDHRHYLYEEYLNVLAKLQPPVFLMENVTGLLSARIGDDFIIDRIVNDLTYLSGTEKQNKKEVYRLYPLSDSTENTTGKKIFIVRSEDYGVPQARHRVFILGIRSDISIEPDTLDLELASPVGEVIGSLPKIRSGVSRGTDSELQWKQAIGSAVCSTWLPQLKGTNTQLRNHIKSVIKSINRSSLGRYSTEYCPDSTEALKKWFVDHRLKSLTSHETRSHMVGDLHRYLFASCYAEKLGDSPKLSNYPDNLLPLHKNVFRNSRSLSFSDRFRVQTKEKVSSTITSHISKDGHYFIHYDPEQCRSLTVREAARLQTFPDNFHFEGPRTNQYHQVGNAVPPYLAVQIAKIVKNLLDQIPE